MTATQRLADLGIELTSGVAPMANYVPALRDGDTLYVSGHVPRRNGVVVTGRVGVDVTVDEAHAIARMVAVDILATIHETAGIDNVEQLVRVCGYIRGGAEFGDQPAVLNGASDLFVDVFGPDHGRHTRAAVGVAELPANAVLEIDAIARLR